MRNVSRCWAYETACILDCKLPEEIPKNEYYEYYGPDFNLHITPSNMENQNSQRELNKITTSLFECLKELPSRPCVQYTKPLPYEEDDDDAREDDQDADVRRSQLDEDREIMHDAEFYDGEEDQDVSFGSREPGSGLLRMDTAV